MFKNTFYHFYCVKNNFSVVSKLFLNFIQQYCDAHMNSEDMWQSHITGKRHITVSILNSKLNLISLIYFILFEGVKII